MAGGERGVERATEILIREMRRTMQLLGVRSIAELDRSCVKLRPS
jgi:L-lactate dehydrogenase (cytochrome)